MNNSFRVGNLFGIPFYLHPSWLLVLLLITWNYGSGLASSFPGLGLASWLLGLATALLLFASVLAHELGHSFVAKQQGIEVKSINLFLFGGLANLEKESKTPGEAFWVAIAGPIVSAVLFGLFTLIGATTGVSGAIGAIVGLLASINLALALFNLIPGLPLDGGNILKALVWKITGNPYKGVVFAGRVGQIFGWVAIASGLIPLFLYGTFGGVWNLLIGWFLLQNANRATQTARVQDRLAGLTAQQAVVPDSPIVSADLSLRTFANEYVIGQAKWRRFLVTDDSERLIGAISLDSLKTIPTSAWTETYVQELMQPIDFSTAVESDRSLLEVVNLLEQRQLTQLPVVRDNGVLVGLLEKAAIIRLLQQQFQANLA
jgi:Zn-dependent protease/CBS domain-containing protein